MAKYVRIPRTNTIENRPQDLGKTAGYEVYGEKPVEVRAWPSGTTQEHPHGYVRVSTTRDHYFPYWDETTETGLSRQFMSHAYDTRHMGEAHSDQIFGKSNRRISESIKDVAESYYDGPAEHDFDNDPSVRRVNKDFYPETLFAHVPARAIITDAYVHPDLRHTFPVMAQLIKQDYPHHALTASGDLSEHSAKIAKAAHERGLVEPHPGNPDFEVTNSIDFDDMTVSPDTYYLSATSRLNENVVPESRVASAKQQLRETLRGSRPKKSPLSPQFDHPTLPGIE